jgi:superfamily II DNA or RNA helicase
MVTITISNNIRVKGLINTRLRCELTAALTIPNPKYAQLKRLKKPVWGISPKLELYFEDQGDLILPRGFELQALTILCKAEYSDWPNVIYDQTEGNACDFGTWNDKFLLRDYQQTALNTLNVIKNDTYQNGILVAPAGSGKTNIALRYIFEKGRVAVWLTHTHELMIQTRDRAESLISKVGKIGLIGNGKFDLGDGKLIIAMVQTLTENQKIIDEFLNEYVGTVVIDECHHTPCPTFTEVIARFKAKNMLGVTATPDRKDQLEAYMYFGIGPLLYTVPRQELYDNNQLLIPEIKFIYTKFQYEQASLMNKELCNVDAGGEDLNFHELINALINDKSRLELVTKTILDYAKPGNYSLVISESVRYCYMIRDLLKESFMSLRIEVIHGPIQRFAWKVAKSKFEAIRAVEEKRALKWDLKGRSYRIYAPQYSEEEFKNWQITAEKRKDIMERVNARKIDILIVTQLGKEGIDIPHLTTGFLTTPMKGDSQQREDGSGLTQYVGRIQRVDPKNTDKKPIWIDFVDQDTGVLYSQYLTRRKVYKRLGLTVPNAPKRKIEEINDFLGGISFADFKF